MGAQDWAKQLDFRSFQGLGKKIEPQACRQHLPSPQPLARLSPGFPRSVSGVAGDQNPITLATMAVSGSMPV